MKCLQSKKEKKLRPITTSLVVRRMHLDSETGLGDFIERPHVVGGALCGKDIVQRTLVNLGGQQKNLVARSLSTSTDLRGARWSCFVGVVAFLVARQPRAALFDVQWLVVVLIAFVGRRQDGVNILV
jgi:hypothetical protein